jgi:hypothetical protein
VRNIKVAVSRLPFGKKAHVRITNATTGLVVFEPDPGKKFDYQALANAYKRASYGIKQVELTATGTLEERPDPSTPGQTASVLNVKDTGNVFLLQPAAGSPVAFPKPGAEVTVSGVVQHGQQSPDGLAVTRIQVGKSPAPAARNGPERSGAR